ncbi:hypothetical protein MchiMG62_10830 [Methanoculleus chikugoensis]|uniref:Uncharacterized protein n=1 Tax=Methanoculleus chikugoensis TaxID=118126 RepID=A0ABM7H554_9EURY|nr:hypothetical protein MchiMG62_10830 [Methanoculleus chikugoensis]
MHFPLRIDGVGPEHILYPMESALVQARKVFAGLMMALLDARLPTPEFRVKQGCVNANMVAHVVAEGMV